MYIVVLCDHSVGVFSTGRVLVIVSYNLLLLPIVMFGCSR
jgi:hypothetical protein